MSVFLIPVSTSTKLFHDFILPNAEIEFLRGRVKFGKRDFEGNFYYPNDKASPGTKDSMLVMFKGKTP